MLLVITANPALDKSYRIDRFTLGELHRAASFHQQAGGKGINVARVYQRLGGRAVSSGFLGGYHGRLIARALETEGLANEFITTKDEARLCLAVVDSAEHTVTEINEAGPPITTLQERKLIARVDTLLARERFDFLVMSGSLPPKASPNLYARLIEVARRRDVLSVVDTSGDALKHAIAAKPWMIKPNQKELESVAGHALPTLSDVILHAKSLQAGGIAFVAVSRGAHGACLIGDNAVTAAKPPGIHFVSAVGSGDSFLAAFLWSWTSGANPGNSEAALRLAVAAGSANAEVIGAGACSQESIFRLEPQVKISRVD
jgi:1-phosphofructokinase family hexose kinase